SDRSRHNARESGCHGMLSFVRGPLSVVRCQLCLVVGLWSASNSTCHLGSGVWYLQFAICYLAFAVRDPPRAFCYFRFTPGRGAPAATGAAVRGAAGLVITISGYGSYGHSSRLGTPGWNPSLTHRLKFETLCVIPEARSHSS